jgi:DNA repair protein RecN (Recombination protein N)
MLQHLSIKNLAVVEALDLSFESGMSAVTGETGAGKSIILQALGLVLGVRADSTLVRFGADKADISAIFSIEHNIKACHFLHEQSLSEDNTCILRRVVSSDGKSRAFVNGVGVPASVLKNVGEFLVDIHGQNEHQLLLKPDQQLAILDNYAKLNQQKKALNLLVAEHQTQQAELLDLQASQTDAIAQQDLYSQQLAELENAQLNQEELDTIEADFKQQANAQSLIEKVSSVLTALERDAGVGAQLLHLSHELSQALDIDARLTQSHDMLNSAQLQTQESIYELNAYLSTLPTDNEALQLMEARISELHELGRKHHCKIVELLQVQTRIAQKLEALGSSTYSLIALQTKLDKLVQTYQIKAQDITKKRIHSAQDLSKKITDAMQILGMPGGEFCLNLPTKAIGIHLNGLEGAEFLVKTNMGSDFKPLKKVVSGGELSRISLAIAVINSDNDQMPLIVFDEVDVGISGAVAAVVGRRLRELSTHYQLICITHLAQVASFAHQHLRVHKHQSDQGVKTSVEVLSEKQRIEEIARILGGSVITDKTRTAAAEMIEISATL